MGADEVRLAGGRGGAQSQKFKVKRGGAVLAGAGGVAYAGGTLYHQRLPEACHWQERKSCSAAGGGKSGERINLETT